jgi:hypothetical protein
MKIRVAILAACASALFLAQPYVAQAKDDGIVINLPWSKGDPLKKKNKDGSSRTIWNPAPQYDQKSNGKGISENGSPRPRDR